MAIHKHNYVKLEEKPAAEGGGVWGYTKVDMRDPLALIYGFVTTHELRVLSVASREERVMSDVWDSVMRATVWNPETGQPESVYVTDGNSSSNGCRSFAEVDALPEYQAAYAAYRAAEAAEKAAQQAKYEADKRAAEAREPKKGRRVKVVRGRKIPVGTEGQCFWMGDTRYGTRVGLKNDAGETIWVDAKNVEAVV